MSALIEALKVRARQSLSPTITLTRNEDYIYALGYLVGCLTLDQQAELTAQIEKENQKDKALA